MVGKSVVMYLKNPLFQFKYKKEGKMVLLPRDLVQIMGQVVKEKGAGLWIKVLAMGGNDLSMTEDLPFDQIFIPYAKIDYMVFKG